MTANSASHNDYVVNFYTMNLKDAFLSLPAGISLLNHCRHFLTASETWKYNAEFSRYLDMSLTLPRESHGVDFYSPSQELLDFMYLCKQIAY